MSLSTLFLSAALSVTSSDILRDEFGIHDDRMPSVSVTQQITKRNFYQRHKRNGILAPLTQRNSGGHIRAENSQFGSAPIARGSTLPPRSTNPFPRAPSRFSRSSFSIR